MYVFNSIQDGEGQGHKRPPHINLNYFPFFISLNKCNRCCNTIDDLSRKQYLLRKAKDKS